jgi:hypothetical protein
VIQFRLTDGESMRGEFDVNAPLWDARSWLDANRKDSGSLYDLAIPFPKRILTDADLDKSFAELQLFPRASLLLIPKKRSQAPRHDVSDGAGASGEQPGFVGGVTRAVGGVLGYLNPMAYFGGGAPAERTTQPAGQRPWEYGEQTVPQSPFSWLSSALCTVIGDGPDADLLAFLSFEHETRTFACFE